jgi:protein phosphatase
MNDMFEQMPLAAVLSEKNSNNKVFAVHAGIGSSIQKIDDIEKIQRPLKITLGAVNDQIQQAAMDLLWSDPTPSEDTLGIHPNLARDPQKQNNISLYGADIVEKFLKNNQISMMIRANQICMDGMDRYANN